MKNILNPYKRFLALLLAVVMIVGLLPVSVGAETVPTDAPAFSADIARVYDSETIEYTYTVTAYSGETDVSDQASYAWTESAENTANSYTVKKVEDTTNVGVTVSVAYNGRILQITVTGDSEDDITQKCTWDASVSGSAAYGVCLAPQVTLSTEENGDVRWESKTEEEALWQWTYNDATTAQSGDNYFPTVISDTEVLLATASLPLGDGSSVVRTFESAVHYADAEVSFENRSQEVPGEGEWAASEQTIRVSVQATEVTDSKYLPPVLVDGTEYTDTWTNADGVWTKDVTLEDNGEYTISCGTDSYIVKIDKNAPSISDDSLYAYMISDNSALVFFDITDVGPSGISEIWINEESIDLSDTMQYSHNVSDCSVNDTITIKITAGNGKEASKSTTVQEGITLVVSEPDAVVGKTDTTTYLSAGRTHSIQVQINGLSSGKAELDTEKSYYTLNGGEAVYASNWPSTDSLTFTVDADNPIESLKFSLTDSYGNITTEEIGAYKVDTIAPVVSVSRNIAPVNTVGTNEYFQEIVEYTFTVTDDLLTGTTSGGAVVTYKYAGGVQQTAELTADTATIKVKVYPGQTLELLSVAATDASGNAASSVTVADSDGTGLAAMWSAMAYTGRTVSDNMGPKIEVSITPNIKGYAKVGEDERVFAILESTEDPVTFTATVTLTDANLDPINLIGWTYNSQTGAYTKTFSSGEIQNYRTGSLTIPGLSVTDYALNSTENYNLNENDDSDGGQAPIIPVTAADGVTIHFDRRYPSGGAIPNVPTVDFIPFDHDGNEISPASQIEAGGGNPIHVYNGSLDHFRVTVNDNSDTPEHDSGVALVAYSFSDMNYVTLQQEEGDVYYIPVEIEDNTDESRHLTLQVKDNAENTYTYNYDFQVDTVAPDVTVTKTTAAGTGYAQTVDGIDFYTGAVTYQFAAADAHGLEKAELIYQLKGGEKQTLDFALDGSGAYTCSFTVTEGQELTSLEIIVKDVNQCVAGKVTVNDTDERTRFDASDGQLTYEGNHVVVDSTPPAASLEITTSEGAAKNQRNGVDYYDGEVTVTVSVTEKDLHSATLSYIFENEADNRTVVLSSSENGWTHDAVENRYSHTITVENGQVLKDIQLTAVDKAGHQPKAQNSLLVNNSNQTDEDGNSILSYSGNPIAVDTQVPEVHVMKTGNATSSFNGVAYYNQTVTYAITVTDMFMEGLEPVAQVTYMDGTTVQIPLVSEAPQEGAGNQENGKQESKLGETEEFKYLLNLKDGDGITSIRIKAQDNALQRAESLTDSNVSFTYEDGSLVYSGSEIVDTTKPEVAVDFSDNVASFYTNGTVAYARLTNPSSGESGSPAPQTAETVTVTITVTDKNLTIDPAAINCNVATEIPSDTGELTISADGTKVCYTKSVTVAPDHTGVIMFDLTVHDLAKHEPGTVVPQLRGETTMESALSWDENNGRIASMLSVDRRRPTSGESQDGVAPVITITPSITPVSISDDLDLFDAAFYYSVHISDGSIAEETAGLDAVSWTLTDNAKAAVDDISSSFDPEDYSRTADFTIDVPVKAFRESNALTLQITAVDNVGNTTTYTKTFAADNQAPRVNVFYNNNSAVNGKYFNADRTITVTVEDINFNPEATTVTTEISGTGWMRSGNVYTAIYSYTNDGDYSFDMSCADMAGNVSGIDFFGGVAPHDFVIDKTAPVINVAYTSSAPASRDGSVLYYSSDVDATVTITEQNFNSADVKAEFTANNGLNSWYNNGEAHVASTLFTEGNNYKFSVAYTDLAGNAAVPFNSDVFTVDTHAPTIQISQGSMSTDELNIIQGDLELGFAINDRQGNLKNITATLIKLGNTFETVELSGDAYYTVRNEKDRTNIYVDFANIAKDKLHDGIYIVRITAEDYSGNTVALSPDLRFSLNRFGSTFTTDDPYTMAFLATGEDGNAYHNEVQDKLVIKEINPNRVWRDGEQKEEGSSVTIVVNGSSRLLVQDVDYTMRVSEEGSGSGKWYVYTYEIDPANFMANDKLVDGRYSILFYGEDEAGNLNTNEADMSGSVQKSADGKYSGKAVFTLDCSDPIITILGVEEGRIYNEAFKRVNIGISDSTPINIAVYVDDQPVALQASTDGLANDQMWLVWDAASDTYVLNLVEQDALLDGQNIRVVATDAAGNDAEEAVEDVLLSTHWLVRLISSPWLIALIVLAAAVVVVFFVLRRKKNKNAAQRAAG